MTKDPVNMLIHAVFPKFFDENGNYIGEPLTKKEEKELRKILTEEIGKEQAEEALKELAKKEESKMANATLTKEKFAHIIGRDTLTVEKVLEPKGDFYWYNGNRCYKEVEPKFLALKTFVNKEGEKRTVVIGAIDPTKDWITQLTELWTADHKRLQEKRAEAKK